MTYWDGNLITGATVRVILGGHDGPPDPLGAAVMFGNVLPADMADDARVLIDGNPMPYSDLVLILAGDAPAGGPYMLGGAVVLPAEGQDQ